jgi:hypothetical protein
MRKEAKEGIARGMKALSERIDVSILKLIYRIQASCLWGNGKT